MPHAATGVLEEHCAAMVWPISGHMLQQLTYGTLPMWGAYSSSDDVQRSRSMPDTADWTDWPDTPYNVAAILCG